MVTGLLMRALCVIRDVDRPFVGITGTLGVEPTASAEVERQATRDHTATPPAAGLPCDDKGNRQAA